MKLYFKPDLSISWHLQIILTLVFIDSNLEMFEKSLPVFVLFLLNGVFSLLLCKNLDWLMAAGVVQVKSQFWQSNHCLNSLETCSYSKVISFIIRSNIVVLLRKEQRNIRKSQISEGCKRARSSIITWNKRPGKKEAVSN